MLLGAQAAKGTHIHLCLGSQLLLQQSVFALKKGVGNGGLKTAVTVCGMVASPSLAFHVAALPEVTKHSLVLWC